MRLASAVTLKAYEAAYRALQPGMTQDDVSRTRSRRRTTALGFPGGAGVQVGEYTALPHGSIQPQTIREGTIIMIDGGCTVEGYQSDITRTFVLGKPTDKMNEASSTSSSGRRPRRSTAARPGVPLEALDAAARKVDRRRRLRPRLQVLQPPRRPRHGHGRPRVAVPREEQHVRVGQGADGCSRGMTFSDEPGIYIRGEFGVRLEDDMHITENGAELFTPQSESLGSRSELLIVTSNAERLDPALAFGIT